MIFIITDREEDPRIKELCNKCCSPGIYEHGNEKCGLAINSHNFAFELMRNLASESDVPENMVISPFR